MGRNIRRKGPVGETERIDIVEKLNRRCAERRGRSTQLSLTNAPQFLARHAAGDATFATGQADEVKWDTPCGEFAQQAGGEELVIRMREYSDDRTAIF